MARSGPHSSSTKKKIGKAIAAAWAKLTPKARKARIKAMTAWRRKKGKKRK